MGTIHLDISTSSPGLPVDIFQGEKIARQVSNDNDIMFAIGIKYLQYPA
jgi:hypothetical protein